MSRETGLLKRSLLISVPRVDQWYGFALQMRRKMMKKIALSGFLLLCLYASAQTAAGKNHSMTPDSAIFSASEWAIVKTLSPLPALPVDATNKYRDSPAAALLGQKLF